MRGRGRGGGDAPRDRPRGVRKAERAVDVRARRARGPDVGRTHHDATVGKEGGRGEGEGERAPPDLRTSRAGFRGWVRQERARVGRAAAATARSNARAGRPPRRDICRQMRERGALGEEKNVERGRFVEGGSRASRRAVATDGRAHLRRIADAGGRFAGDRARLEGARDRLSARARGSIRLVQVSIIIVNFSGPNAIDEVRLTRQRNLSLALASLVPAFVFAPSPLSRWATPRWRTRATGTPPSRRARTSGIGWIRSRTPGGARVAASARRARSRRRLPPTRRTPRRLARRARRSRWRRRWRRSTPPPVPRPPPSRRSAPRSSSPWPRARARARARPSATSPSRATASCAFASWRSAAASARSCGTPR